MLLHDVETARTENLQNQQSRHSYPALLLLADCCMMLLGNNSSNNNTL